MKCNKTQTLSVIIGLLSMASLCFTACKPDNRTVGQRKLDAALENIKAPEIPAQAISITALGAKADSLSDCLPAFEKAFSLAKHKKGGLRVIVPAGIYFINGPLHLVSNVCIDLQKGARLKFSSEPGRYLPPVFTSWEGTFVYNYSPLIYGYGLKNVSIIGQGTLDGNAAQTFSKWRDLQDRDQRLTREMNHNRTPVQKRVFGLGTYLRPQFIQLFECKNILIEGVTITNSPFWCVHLLKSENATVRGVNFTARNINNDGVDPEYSKNILIENINFDNGDDNVAIKAGRDTEGRAMAMPSENIVIRNCKFKGLHGVVVGSEMSGGVRNVFVENCSTSGYLKRGIFLKSNPDRGGFISDIYVNNVHFGEVEDCFYITSFYHGEGKGHVTDIHDVYVENVSCRKARNAGIVVQGFPEKPVTNICFKNVRVDSAKVALSLTNTDKIVMGNVTIGGAVEVAPSTAK